MRGHSKDLGEDRGMGQLPFLSNLLYSKDLKTGYLKALCRTLALSLTCISLAFGELYLTQPSKHHDVQSIVCSCDVSSTRQRVERKRWKKRKEKKERIPEADSGRRNPLRREGSVMKGELL